MFLVALSDGTSRGSLDVPHIAVACSQQTRALPFPVSDLRLSVFPRMVTIRGGNCDARHDVYRRLEARSRSWIICSAGAEVKVTRGEAGNAATDIYIAG